MVITTEKYETRDSKNKLKVAYSANDQFKITVDYQIYPWADTSMKYNGNAESSLTLYEFKVIGEGAPLTKCYSKRACGRGVIF